MGSHGPVTTTTTTAAKPKQNNNNSITTTTTTSSTITATTTTRAAPISTATTTSNATFSIPKITRRRPSTSSDITVSSISSAAQKIKRSASPSYYFANNNNNNHHHQNNNNHNHNHHNDPKPNTKSPTVYYTSTSNRLGLSFNALSTYRPPLRPLINQSGKRNDIPLVTTRSSAIGAATKMPTTGDRKMQTQPQPQPFISASAARIANRPPLTPKVAATTSISAASSATTSTVATPLGRRATNSTPAYTTGPQNTKDEAAAPVASLMTSNVTPRSGKRMSRVEGPSNTPNDTPTLGRMSNNWESRDTRPLRAASPSVDLVMSSPSGSPESDRDSKFFYASDAKSNNPQPQLPRPTSNPQKAATFFYANGLNAENGNTRKITPPSSAPSLAPSLALTEQAGSKFVYANGTPDPLLARPILTTSASASTVSSSSRAPGGRPSTSNSATSYPPPRPTSPIKLAAVPVQGLGLRGSALAPGPAIRPQITSPPTLAAPGADSGGRRRVSIEAPPKLFKRGHARTGSVPITEPLRAPAYASPTRMSPEPISPPLSPGSGLSHPAISMATILQAVEDLEDDPEPARDDHPTEPSSPTKSAHESDAISESVANARRERKVQDLEITNVSLEAINRTLEKQLRKQTAELRRYRRLSRSGRLSITSSRVVSAAQDPDAIKLSDLIEDEDDTEEEEDDEEEDDDSMYDSDPSDSNEDALGIKAVKRRQRDEKRLQLDLSKHQELLIDSQKINQSIKRCLDWTEVLIKEGQKALAYHVRPSEVEFGGRVLTMEDEGDDEVSQIVEGDLSRQLEELELETPTTKAQDRDSGIDLQPT